MFKRNTKLLSLVAAALATEPRFDTHSGNKEAVQTLVFERVEFKDSDIEKLREFTGLQELYISGSKFSSLGKLLSCVKHLKKLSLDSNGLETLPNELGELTDLEILGLKNNKLRNLPDFLFNLTKLQILDIQANRLEKLPPKITNLKSLEKLLAVGNKLTELPEEFGNLTNLKALYLSYNRIKRLPTGLGMLNELVTLQLKKNKLKEIPAELGNLKNLADLNLSDNKLTHLPITFKNLRSRGLHLNLERNPVANRNSENGLGLTALYSVFGKNIAYDSLWKTSTRRLGHPVLEKEKVLTDLRAKKIHWNLPVLKKLMGSSTPKRTHSEETFMKLWKANFEQFVKRDESIEMYLFISKLFSPGMDFGAQTRDFCIDPELADLTLGLIEGIFNELHCFMDNAEMENKEKRNLVAAYLRGILAGIKEGPVRQYLGLKSTFRYLKKYMPVSLKLLTLKGFVEDFIAEKKEVTFDHVFTPKKTNNVRALPYWKNKLWKDLGLDISAVAVSMLRDDEFDDQPGNALKAFFTAFTPKTVISELVKEINKSDALLAAVSNFMIQADFSDRERERMVKRGSLGPLTLKAVKTEFVEFYLLQLGILERAGRSSSTQRQK